MTNDQQNQDKMHGVTLQYFVDNPIVLVGRKSLADLVTSSTSYHTLISTLDTEIEGLRNSGAYKGKVNTRESFEFLTLTIQSKISVYAELNGNDALLAAMKYTATDIKNMSDPELLSAAGAILQISRNEEANLVDVGVTKEDNDELEGYITQYTVKKDAPRSKTVKISTKIKDLSNLFKGINKNFKMMDKLMLELKKSDPSLYNLYKAARRIEDRGGKTKTPTPEEIVKKAELAAKKLKAKNEVDSAKKTAAALKKATKAEIKAAEEAAAAENISNGTAPEGASGETEI